VLEKTEAKNGGARCGEGVKTAQIPIRERSPAYV